MTEEKVIESFKIVGLPKGSVMWPTAATALLFGLVGLVTTELMSLFTTIFFIVFAVNLLILFFDFARGAVFGIFGLIVAAFSLGYALEINIPFLDLLRSGVVSTTPQFFISFGAIFLILLIIAIFFRRAFEYFEVSSNEIVRKFGILGDAQRFNAPSLEIKKEIDDVFESILLFGAGDLRITTPKGKEFHINNVPRINKVEAQIRKLLARTEVDIN